MHDAVLTGVETRTSSPIRIKRDGRLSRASTRAACIRPAKARATPAAYCPPAVDGIKVAEAVALSIAGGGRDQPREP